VEARKFVHSLKLKSRPEWELYCKSGKKPNDIPTAVPLVFKKQWKGWGDWLGSFNVSTKEKSKNWLSYKKAKIFVHKLKLNGQSDWNSFSKSKQKPKNIPSSPQEAYKKKGWISWGDWLGTGTIATYEREYLPFNQARLFAQNLKLESQTSWKKFCNSGKRPNDIPSHPDGTYKKEWKGWGDWLGTGTIATFEREYLPFNEAKEYIHNLKFKNQNEWRIFSKSNKKPKNIPTNPNIVYKKDWKGMGDWIGTGRIADQLKQYRSFKDTRKFIRSLGLKNQKEWIEYCKSGKKPVDIPAAPWKTYSKEQIIRRMKKK